MAGALVMPDPYELFRQDFYDLLDPRLYSCEWLDAQVWCGAFRVFGTNKACILVSLKSYPTGLHEIHGEAAAGELNEITDLIRRAEDWGRSIGCVAASIASREGWARHLAKDGWQVHQTVLRKEL